MQAFLRFLRYRRYIPTALPVNVSSRAGSIDTQHSPSSAESCDEVVAADAGQRARHLLVDVRSGRRGGKAWRKDLFECMHRVPFTLSHAALVGVCRNNVLGTKIDNKSHLQSRLRRCASSKKAPRGRTVLLRRPTKTLSPALSSATSRAPLSRANSPLVRR